MIPSLKTRHTRRRRVASGEAGMTLIEILVVLAIVAVASAVAVLAIGDDHGMSGLAEAKRIAGRVQYASDRSLTGEGPLAFVVTERGYSFLERTENGAWVPAVDLSFGSDAKVADGLTLAPQGSPGPYVLGADSGGQPFEIELSSSNRTWSIAYDGMTARATPGVSADQ